jgi:hypothetical protein
MAVDYRAIRDALVSAALSTGHYERVAAHEPKNAPGNGLTCAVWSAGWRPARSGLASTSLRLLWTVQTRCSMQRAPLDEIDLDCLAANDAVAAALSSDVDLGVAGVRMVDLLGAEGEPMKTDTGHVDHDGHWYRVFELAVPVIINDVFSQGT